MKLPRTQPAAGSYQRLVDAVIEIPRWIKQAVMVGFDLVGMPLVLLLAFALKADALGAGLDRDPALYVAVTVVSVSIFGALGLYRSVVRYMGPKAMLAIVGGVTGSAVALALMAATMAPRPPHCPV